MAENIITTICTCGAGLEATFNHSTYNTIVIEVEPCYACAIKTVIKGDKEKKLRKIFEDHYFNHYSTKKSDLDY